MCDKVHSIYNILKCFPCLHCHKENTWHLWIHHLLILLKNRLWNDFLGLVPGSSPIECLLKLDVVIYWSAGINNIVITHFLKNWRILFNKILPFDKIKQDLNKRLKNILFKGLYGFIRVIKSKISKYIFLPLFYSECQFYYPGLLIFGI